MMTAGTWLPTPPSRSGSTPKLEPITPAAAVTLRAESRPMPCSHHPRCGSDRELWRKPGNLHARALRLVLTLKHSPPCFQYCSCEFDRREACCVLSSGLAFLPFLTNSLHILSAGAGGADHHTP